MRSPWQHLFHPANAGRYREAVGSAVDHLVDHLGETGGRPLTGISPREAAARATDVDLDRPIGDGPEALAELSRLWLDDAIWFHEPAAAAHLNCPVVIPALAAEVFISGVNSSLDTFDQSAGATFIERHLVDWTAARIGYDDRADGVFTTGGTQSNLQALLLARGQQEGRAPERLRIFASADGHFSVQKAARILGLGDESVVPVAVDVSRRMDPAALSRALGDAAAAGLTPMAVVATAGTTDFGAIDPLPEVAALAKAHGAWFHVDAAYGGGLLVSPRRRSWLAGIELADSVSIDYHKTWFQPVSCSALVVRDGATLGHVTWHADYLNPKDSAHPNQVDKSLQTTRRFEALKLWMTLRVMGADAIGEHLDTVLDLADAVAAELTAMPDIDVAAAPQLSTIVFRHVPGPDRDEDGLARHNAAIRAELFDDGRALVAATRVDGRAYLKLTLLNPIATVDDVLGVVAMVRETGERLQERPTAPRPRGGRLAVAR
ncbi:aminotransferase class V-fold PLP-dependent enzyme [Nocardioides oleivorans]|uniref:Aminotransferase class V-fold PLP-dependent enzyme n=1 Tax=Nocardioides oleivorans TaxID=273676 RepID=A0A4Q2S1S2_9ACTN|nr:aspartate aminotransferase family protein [Nocardioides oleivorans]RYB94335.1 aminotransferase class V-fold PLP-dependent enzyme [Nocardioides oleivorans]